MSADPSLALQRAVNLALRASIPEVANRVYDEVPQPPIFPYIVIGECQTLGEYADCYNGSESFLDIHVWSQSTGFPEAKLIADKAREAIHGAGFVLDGHVLDLLEFQSSRALRDPDGKRRHIVLTFRALTHSST